MTSQSVVSRLLVALMLILGAGGDDVKQPMIVSAFVVQSAHTPRRRCRDTSSIQRTMPLLAADKSDEGTADDDDMERKRLQVELESKLDDPPMFGSFNADNLDESLLPVPLFTGIMVLLLSLYVMVYGIYVGIMGFPEDGPPRIF